MNVLGPKESIDAAFDLAMGGDHTIVLQWEPRADADTHPISTTTSDNAHGDGGR